MIYAAIIPDRQVVRLLPAQPYLEIMILHDQLHKPIQKAARFFFRQPVDVLDVVADGEHGLPTGDGVRADDRVHGLEDVADVLGGAAGGGVHLEVVA